VGKESYPEKIRRELRENTINKKERRLVRPVSEGSYSSKGVLRINQSSNNDGETGSEKEEELITTGERNTVNVQQLNEVRVKYLTELNQEGKKNLEGILKSAVLELAQDGFTIICKIANPAAKSEMDRHKSEIINRFRQTLRNDDLVLNCVIQQASTSSVGTKKVFTRKDKYEKLVEKNKHLKDLRDVLGLDYDM